MKTIKNIVVATDFSTTSRTAYDYARHLAQHFNASIQLINVYPIMLSIAEDPQLMGFPEYMVDLYDNTMKLLKDFSANERDSKTITGTHVKVECKAIPGFAGDKLVELSFDPSIDLIVLGATGEHSQLDKFFGSVSVKVARESNCPVLLVPREAHYRDIQHIVYGCAEESIQWETVRTALDWARYFSASVHFVHIKLPTQAYNYYTNEQILKRIVNQEKDSVPCDIVSYHAEDVKEGIYRYAQNNKSDLLTIVTHQRGFWESVRHTSITSAITWEAVLPILVLHSDEKNSLPTHIENEVAKSFK